PEAGPDELLEILVAGDDDDVQTLLDALFGERADDVVGFITIQCENWNMVRVEDVADTLHAAVEVRLQLFGELFARRLVGGISLMAEREPRVVDPAEVVGLVGLEQTVEEVDDAPRRRRVLAAARGER